METKAGLSPNGCFAKALMNEGMFILLARDKSAPHTIRFWANHRAQTAVEESESQDAEQLTEALEAADAFEQWRIEHDGEWRGHHGHVPDLAPTPDDETSSAGGRVLASKDPFRDRKLIRSFSQIIADAGVTRLVVDGQQETDDLFADALSQVFGRLYEDAHRLAGFVMRADRQAGPNHG